MTGSICGWTLNKVNIVMSVMFGSGPIYKSENDDCSLHSRLQSSAPTRPDRTSSVLRCLKAFSNPLSRSNFLQQGQDNHRERYSNCLRDLAILSRSYNLKELQ